MSRAKKRAFRKAVLRADREGEDRPSKRWWRKNNRQRRKRVWIEYRAAIRQQPILRASVVSGNWPDNHAEWVAFNACCDTITRGEMILGMKALAWKHRQRETKRCQP